MNNSTDTVQKIDEKDITKDKKSGKSYIRKPKPAFDSQKYRRIIQLFWSTVTVLIGIQFYFFVYYFINDEKGIFLGRPPGVEGFLPISSLISLRHIFLTGEIPLIHPAGLVLLLTIVLMSLLFKKSFCSFICPVGLFSEGLAKISRRIFKKRIHFPRVIDYFLRSLKYILLAFFIYALFFQMTPKAIELFLYSPYNKVSDVKMLLFFTEMSSLTLWVLAGLVVLSVLYEGFWCRFLCPYGALLGIISFFSPAKIKRKQTTCIDCEKCSRVCPQRIKVHKLKTVRSDECFACMACVDACPVKDTLNMKITKKRILSPKLVVISAFLAFLIPIWIAKFAGYWHSNITRDEYKHHIKNINSPVYHHNRGKVPEYQSYSPESHNR